METAGDAFCSQRVRESLRLRWFFVVPGPGSQADGAASQWLELAARESGHVADRVVIDTAHSDRASKRIGMTKQCAHRRRCAERSANEHWLNSRILAIQADSLQHVFI